MSIDSWKTTEPDREPAAGEHRPYYRDCQCMECARERDQHDAYWFARYRESQALLAQARQDLMLCQSAWHVDRGALEKAEAELRKREP